ncbi:MAG: hypothetical protein RL757_585 [Bacteroidota bacterium]|jgi:hypothetical protein
MKNHLLRLIFAVSSLLFCNKNSHAQTNVDNYFQQFVEYKIAATLDTATHTLAGEISFVYTNKSPDALPFLYIHLWANAFGTRNSAYARQLNRQGQTKFYFADEADLGKYKNLSWKTGNTPLEVIGDSKNPDIIKIMLPKPLASGESVTLGTPFSLKIPRDFSRLGRKPQPDGSTAYYVTQWFPKPAVYDKTGWHPMPYLDQGEFYSDFGNYDVTLTLPADMVVASTGTPTEKSENDFLLARSKDPKATHPQSGGMKTLHYVVNSVVDFAWFAAKNFEVSHDELTLSGGKKVATWGFYPPEERKNWSKSAKYIKRAVEFYSDNVGQYPFSQASAVCGGNYGGGMEYPMVTLIGGGGSEKSMDIVIAHEVGHNWFQGILATNERDQPWMDEGMNTFYERRYERQFYPKNDKKTPYILGGGDMSMEDLLTYGFQQTYHDACSAMNSDSMGAGTSYYIFAYDRPARMLEKFETKIGSQRFDQAMQGYFKTWRFKHPTPQDFENSFKNEIGLTDALFFNELFYKNSPVESKKETENTKKWQVNFLRIGSSLEKKTLYLSPIMGTNASDGFMAGMFFSNYLFKQQPFRFAVAPMFGFKSKQLAGIGNMDYMFKIPNIGLMNIGLGWKRFGYETTLRDKFSLNYERWSPSISLEFRKKPIDTWTKTLQFRTLVMRPDTLGYDGNGTVTKVSKDLFLIPEISFLAMRQHGLGNTMLKIALENRNYQDYFGGDNQYTRLAVTAQRSIAYRNNRFVDARIFVGSFLKNTGRNRGQFGGENTQGTFSIFQNGSADYRYDGLFLDRNQGNSSQIGNFQQSEGYIRLPMEAAQNFGLSNDFVATMNVTADLPMTRFIKAYYDAGYFRDTRPVGEDKANWLVQTVGLAIDFDFLKINFPLWSSPERLRNLLTERGNYSKRISFSLNLDRINVFRNPKKTLLGQFF